ncbi:MAG: DUF1566 domain-containing protein [Thermodesulfobacteriota bacterium]
MKKWGNDTWRAGAILLLCLFLFASAAWAETDVTTMVKINPGRLLYDRLTKQSYLDVSATNISTEVLLTPITVVIDSVTPSTVTVANAEGVTEDGKPYFTFTTPTGQLLAGTTTAVKKLSFANPTAVRFSYTTRILAELPEAASAIGVDGGSVTVDDPANPAAGVTVEFPAGALTAPSTVTIDTNALSPAPEPAAVIGPMIDLRPSGQFPQPVTISIPYDEELLDQNNVVDEASLRIYTFDAASGLWVPLEDSAVDVEKNVVVGSTDHFSPFCVIPDTLYRHGNLKTSPYAPVLFVHGINLGLGVTDTSFVGDSYRTFGSAVQGIYDVADGPNVYTLNYDTSVDITQSAAVFADAVRKIKNETGAERVNIIAHSMGGLVARAYIQGLAEKVTVTKTLLTRTEFHELYPYKGEIGKLLMLGTPNHGSLLGSVAWANQQAGALFMAKPAGLQLLPDSLFLNKLNSKPFPEELVIDVEYGTGFGSHDGVVSVESARLAPQYGPANLRHIVENELSGYYHSGPLTPEDFRIAELSDSAFLSHSGFSAMQNFVLDADNDGITGAEDRCPSTSINQTAYGHGCSNVQFGQMIPKLEWPRVDERVRMSASGSPVFFQWQPLVTDRLGAVGEKYCLVVKEDDTLGGDTIWDGCDGISEEPYFDARKSITLPPSDIAMFGRLQPGMTYWWTVFAKDEYDNFTNRDLVEWRSFMTYSDYVFSAQEGQEDYYDESREYQSVFSINSNLLSGVMPADSDLYRYLLATANESGSIVEDDDRTLISYWYDSTWGDSLGQDSSFNTVYDVDPGPDADGKFEVVSAGDEEGSQRGTYNTNAYYFSYDALNDSIGSAVTLPQWVDYLKAVRDQYQPIDRLTIFTHGNYGQIMLSDNAILTDATVNDPNHEHYKQLKRLKDEGILAPDAHILLFSCLVAGDDAGKKLVQKIAELTGAYVHANSEYTGNALPASELWVRYNKNEPGNDWDLNIVCSSSGCEPDKATYKMLDLPAKGAINVGPDNIDFLWKVVPNATSYCFNLKDDNAATLIWDNTNGCGADDNFFRTSLEYGKEYQWRVQAFDAAGKLVQSSEWWNFTTGPLALTSRLPDTGQTVCYDNSTSIPCPKPGELFYGQDANYLINPPAYTDHGNGTVTDTITGLMWQQGDNGYTNWYKASGTVDSSSNPTGVDVCGDLTLAGYTDWRLPTKKELVGLVDYSRPYPGPTINTTYFPNTKQSHYWSSSTYAYNPSNAWYVYFYYGHVYNHYKNYNYYVRCVRDGQ